MENKQLQSAKDTIAKKYGFKDFKHAIGGDYVMCGISQKLMPNFMDSVAIEYHRLMSEWVSVDERLPEIGIDKLYPYSSDMILLTDGELVYYGQYENSPDINFGECFIDTDGASYGDSGTIITHWMHTPQPPTK